jgi:hypothetical protein
VSAGLEVMVEVQMPHHWAAQAEKHRQMARAAIRVALRHDIDANEIVAEYQAVRELERSEVAAVSVPEQETAE